VEKNKKKKKEKKESRRKSSLRTEKKAQRQGPTLLGAECLKREKFHQRDMSLGEEKSDQIRGWKTPDRENSPERTCTRKKRR